MSHRQMRMVCRFFVMSCVVMLGRFAVMSCGMCMMLGCVLMMFGSFR
jgi:hypothetical protein